MKSLLAGIFPETEVALVEGDEGAAKALLALPFDHVFFTGSPAVGKAVMRAAAEHLASVTLELGGKSPVLVDADADLRAGRPPDRLGQVPQRRPDLRGAGLRPGPRRDPRSPGAGAGPGGGRLLRAPARPTQASPDYGRILNARHHARLRGLLEGSPGRIELGGDWDAEDNYFAPTVITGVAPDAPLMREEIFGPILPVLEVADLERRCASSTPGPSRWPSTSSPAGAATGRGGPGPHHAPAGPASTTPCCSSPTRTCRGAG